MIYLDHNATTPICPEAGRAMEAAICETPGNPSCSHALGKSAAALVAAARAQVAALVGGRPEEIVFTGCGSEANNLALKGVALRARDRGRHLIVSAVEHPAVLEPARFLVREGWDLTVLPVDGEGLVDPATLRGAIRKDTVLVSIMHANNETGAIQPIADLAAVARERGVLFHTDAAQSCGKVPVDVGAFGVDLLTIVAHKLFGPKGIGALWVRPGVELEPLVHGAGHEGGRRAGTENVVHIAGFGAACAVAREVLAREAKRQARLRDLLEELLREGIPGLVLNGPRDPRLPNTLSVAVPGVPGQAILDGTPEVAASTGAACHTGKVHLSHVLRAMGVPPEVGMGTLRLTLGRGTTEEEIRRAADLLSEAARRLTR